MAYCTLADLQKKISTAELIQLTDDSGLAIDQAKIDAVILEADELIDSYVGKVKTVPLNPVPGLIKNLSVNMAIWNLFVGRGSPDEVRETANRDAMKVLEKLTDRKVTLGDDESVLPESAIEGGPAVSAVEADREFNKTTLGNF